MVVLPYSSGTTGLSKGVMLTHRNLVANVAQMLALRRASTSDDVVLAVLPFFHIYGMQVLMNTACAPARRSSRCRASTSTEFLPLHQEHGVTRSFVAPPIVVALAKHPLVDEYDLSDVQQIFSGAAPLAAELAAEAGARLGCEVVQGYGMTELSPVVAPDAGRRVQARVGRRDRARTPRSRSSTRRPATSLGVGRATASSGSAVRR